LLNLIGNILDMSKISANKLEIEKIGTDLRTTFYNVYDICQSIAKQKNLKMMIELDSSFPTQVETDSSRLSQVILNLLSNAIKFTEEGYVYLKITWVPNLTSQEIECSAESSPELFEPSEIYRQLIGHFEMHKESESFSTSMFMNNLPNFSNLVGENTRTSCSKKKLINAQSHESLLWIMPQNAKRKSSGMSNSKEEEEKEEDKASVNFERKMQTWMGNSTHRFSRRSIESAQSVGEFNFDHAYTCEFINEEENGSGRNILRYVTETKPHYLKCNPFYSLN
jgi:hypothetical protein